MIGAAIAVVVATMTTISVIGRAFFQKPISGDVELTQLGIGIALSLCVPWCQLKGGNIIVDFFTQNAKESTQRKLDGIGTILMAVMLALLAWRTTVGAWSVYQAGETSMILALPGWWVYAALAPGLALATAICLAQTVLHFSGKPLTDLSEPT